MQSLVVTMRRNQKILIIVILVVLTIYYLMLPRKKTSRQRVIDDKKVRHPFSHYLTQVTKNDTLFHSFLHLKYSHPDTRLAMQKYLRPHEFSDALDNVAKQPDALDSFNVENDVLVYIHIQKVGGTVFNSHLINDLILETPCHCEKDVLTNPCYCKTKQGNIWLFSWFTVGWPCGLHADWTMLHECIDKAMNELEGKQRQRRYFYITLLRDPVSRYLSEWQHQKRGEHWEDAKLHCGGKRVNLFEVRPCFQDTWEGVTLREFMQCKDNLATNRQTRMLADLTKSECYKKNKLIEKDNLRLKSAQENLEQMAFFGLTRYQRETQKLFEKTFNMKFKRDFERLDDDIDEVHVSEDEFLNMMSYIELDIQLYVHAKDLFMQRTRLLL
ncbi:heparan-sulfate 6-O-sulfotransferase 1-A-like [Mercenaria mercenaria]|uniref:heparan-sulfate 6-O-sulfotransferase 1-A-like n=1 Tax=Mercenaria mercenaria TaxID=6596 RepID=UPI00234F8370|nr:heparan-sulfate 6-O-sulfotransferase 1-A-like [Mercenaria mercenaria]XP_045201454.2 heparan-sulfate 6-O-sulfotransferase 1-A-like [Mercenaria mercenaria]XP_053403471.1 heparan-sulfate 6-O-sulfotransferase 1-A-like [Mercenaria mercenaria]